MTSRGGAKWGRWLAVPMMVLALGSSLALPARADWEYARWGMSVGEVIAASRGRATKTTPLQQGPSLISTGYFLARAQHAAAGTQFDVKFYFKEGKLSAIAVAPQAPAAVPKLRQELLKDLGEPRTKASKPYGMGMAEEAIWSDPKRGNTVLLRVVDFGDGSERTATLVYSPLQSP
ncbi:MAG TPA: hypothetical protein VGD57_09285 [Candidatus Dormibacteraeota bacterium]